MYILSSNISKLFLFTQLLQIIFESFVGISIFTSEYFWAIYKYLDINNKIKQFSSQELVEWSQNENVPCGKIKSLDEVFDGVEAQQLVRSEMIEGTETKRVTSIAFNLSSF